MLKNLFKPNIETLIKNKDIPKLINASTSIYKNEYRKNAISALGQFSTQEAIDTIINAFYDSDVNIRGHAFKVFKRYGDNPRAIESIKKLTSDSDDFIRIYARDYLEEFQSDKYKALKLLSNSVNISLNDSNISLMKERNIPTNILTQGIQATMLEDLILYAFSFNLPLEEVIHLSKKRNEMIVLLVNYELSCRLNFNETKFNPRELVEDAKIDLTEIEKSGGIPPLPPLPNYIKKREKRAL
ncbi:MAG: hypothetical protein APR55_10575 [Methanolinea sp. SDB]|nr:MAG: hypothetical protein APR55_10575 [Methanolinea sp. SDB]